MSRLIAAVAAVLTIAAALWYVSAPPRDLGGYEERAAHTADSLRSQVQSTRIVVESHIDGQLPSTAALVGIEEAERDASAAAAAFERFEPPAGAVPVRDELVVVADEVSEALAALRIAGQQGDWDELEALSEPLPRLNRRLAALVEQLSS